MKLVDGLCREGDGGVCKRERVHEGDSFMEIETLFLSNSWLYTSSWHLHFTHSWIGRADQDELHTVYCHCHHCLWARTPYPTSLTPPVSFFPSSRGVIDLRNWDDPHKKNCPKHQ